MPDRPAAEIRAAGAVLSRRADSGHEVALIHRSRYDDWSLPKGKREPGEHLLETAVREVAEETGIRVILGRRLGHASYQSLGQPKRVDYWAARPADAGARAGFVPNDEVDALDWLPVPAAPGRLSYQRDISLLAEFAGRPAETIPFILLRHASAGSKRRWSGNDLDRPLDADGAAHAERLAGLLSCFGSCRVISSAAERCVATVRPYAELTGGSIEIEAGLTMPQPGGGTARELKRAAQIIDDGKPAVICAHGENLPSLLQAACARLGARPPKGPPLRKAAWWVLHTAGGALAGAERYHPADT
jgi:8-oxo-dGTP diphosphatase